jgi:hypothetical protein
LAACASTTEGGTGFGTRFSTRESESSDTQRLTNGMQQRCVAHLHGRQKTVQASEQQSS